MKTNKVLFVLICLALFSCDLFNASLDPDYWEKIDAEIAWANAAEVNVSISTGGMGTAIPSGSRQVKLWQEVFSRYGYEPFTINYQPFNQYPFTGWQAWYPGQEPFATWRPGTDEDDPPQETGADKVKFESANETGTHIFIYIYEQPDDENDIIYIGPLGADTDGIEVRILSDTRWGTVFTAPVVNTKTSFSFPVEFAPFGAWDFLGWKAYVYGNQSADNLTPDTLGEELTAQEVNIEVTGIGRAVVTVNTDTPVLLVPLCVTPVRMTHSNPPHQSPTAYAPGQVITITFSTQLDPETIKFEEGFIQITGQSDATPVDITAHYLDPVYNDEMRTVTITPNPDELLTVNTAVSIMLDTGIKGKFGNSLGSPAFINFSVSIEDGVVVNNVYTASNVWALHDPMQYEQEFFSQWANYDRDRRIRKNADGKYEVTLYFGVQAAGDIDNDIEHDIEIVEIHYALLNGSDVSDALGQVVDEGKGSFEIFDNDETSGAGQAYKTANPTAGKYYKAVYTWDDNPEQEIPVQGIIRLAILPSGGTVDKEDWRTVVAESRGFITVVYDNLAPGGTETAFFSGEATQPPDGNSTIYNYNSTNNAMIVNLDFRNIRDNYYNGNNAYGNLNATGSKPRTMDPQSVVQWQWRIVTGTVVNYTNAEWLSLLDSNNDPVYVIIEDLNDIIDDDDNENVRDVQIRYMDSLGNGNEDDESGWNTIGRIRYYNAPVIPALTTWSAMHDGASNITLTWTRPERATHTQVLINGVPATDTEGTTYTITGVPSYSSANTGSASRVREGVPSTVTGYTVSLRAYNQYRETVPVVFNVYNSFPANVPITNNNSVYANNQITLTNALTGTSTHIILTEDITLTAWTPLNITSRNFYGNGYTVTIRSMSTADNMGLFGVASDGIVRDLAVMYETASGGAVTLSPTGAAQFGGIVGTATGNAQILNSRVLGVVNVSGDSTSYIGGIAGLMTGTARIYNAYGGLELTVDCSGSGISLYVGGITGSMGEITGNETGGSAVTAEEISVVADITVITMSGANINNSTRGLFVGGLTGMLYGLPDARAELTDADYRQGTITVTIGSIRSNVGGAIGKSFNHGNITNSSAMPNEFVINKNPGGTQFRVGGFIGDFSGMGKVENCYSTSPVVVNNNNFLATVIAGGFAGRLASDISYCYATGNVVAHGNLGPGGLNFHVGGFVGEVTSGTISDSYSTGNVHAELRPTANFNTGNVGGFAGTSYSVLNCYALGDVFFDLTTSSEITSAINAGGLIGRVASGLVDRSFAVGSVMVQRDDAAAINAGGLVGNAAAHPITNSAALGQSVTATGGSTRNIGRIFGGTSGTPTRNNNHANNAMRLFADTEYSTTDPDLTVTPVLQSNLPDLRGTATLSGTIGNATIGGLTFPSDVTTTNTTITKDPEDLGGNPVRSDSQIGGVNLNGLTVGSNLQLDVTLRNTADNTSIYRFVIRRIDTGTALTTTNFRITGPILISDDIVYSISGISMGNSNTTMYVTSNVVGFTGDDLVWDGSSITSIDLSRLAATNNYARFNFPLDIASVNYTPYIQVTRASNGTYSVTGPFYESTTSGLHNNQQGANTTLNDFQDHWFWRDTMRFNPDVWLFTTVTERDYPILRGPDINHVPGPALGGQ